MECKIGEIFEYNGEWYQCVNGFECTKCDLHQNKRCTARYNDIGSCSKNSRKDNTPVIFKKLEKVEEPYKALNRLFQAYKVFTAITDVGNYDVAMIPHYKTIDIEIKQTKEDMEEKKLNLKPFDIQKAREGKPVCTRDGRKARIICFDSKHDSQRPIIALITDNNRELLYEYTIEGKDDFAFRTYSGTSDLMMLPEKKEGWVNVYKDGLLDTKSYPTKKEAIDKASSNDYVDTVKINWEE